MRSLFKSKFKVTQPFGVNKAYYSKFRLQGHEGIDLIPSGTVWDVLCLENGVVVKDEDNTRSGAYGSYVTVWHPKINRATQYCHFKENNVSNGDKVNTGQKLGLMGATGNVTGAHVHLNLFETDINGVRLNRNNGFLGGIDPLPFLNEDIIPLDTSALEECKRQVEEEIKNKNETYQELEETRDYFESEKKRREFLDNIIHQYANILGTAPDTAEIAGELESLVKKEDVIQEKNREIEKLQKALDESNGLYVELDEKYQVSISNKEDVLKALQEVTDKHKVLDEAHTKLYEAYEDLKEDQKFNYKHLIFGLYIKEKI